MTDIRIKKCRIGEENINKQGLRMWIKEYRKSNDIDVEFEDGYTSKNKQYGNFKKGTISNPNYKNPKIINRIGEKLINNQGLVMEIIDYRMNNDMDVKFEDDYISKNKKYCDFKKGNIKNPYKPEIYGLAYMGECKYNSFSQPYKIWFSMLNRCYDKNFHKKYPTYKDCTVCEEWHNFSNFCNWYDKNYYEVDGEKMHLDKDILIKGNKIYSPETCVFVPERINELFTKNNRKRGKYPIGVVCDKKTKKFISQCNIKKKYQRYLGFFNTELEAFNAYKEFKESYIKQIADEYKDKIPKILYDAMYAWKVEIDD